MIKSTTIYSATSMLTPGDCKDKASGEPQQMELLVSAHTKIAILGHSGSN